MIFSLLSSVALLDRSLPSSSKWYDNKRAKGGLLNRDRLLPASANKRFQQLSDEKRGNRGFSRFDRRKGREGENG